MMCLRPLTRSSTSHSSHRNVDFAHRACHNSYMETQSTLAVPDFSAKTPSLTVTSATQSITSLHDELSKCLNLKDVTVQSPHVGGAYGGKAYLPSPVAAMASVAALVSKQSVLCQLSRNDDMSALGGRPACDASYETKVDASSGKITSLTVKTTVDAGFDKAGGVTLIFKYTNANCYSLGLFDMHLSSSNKITNAAVNTIMRAPGDFQGALFTEAAICDAAFSAKLDPMFVQEANLDKGVMPCWNAMKTQSDVQSKKADTAAFNAANRYRKRGVYASGVKYLAYR